MAFHEAGVVRGGRRDRTGMLGGAGPVKETAPEAIERLHEDGIPIVVLTEDSRSTAEAVAPRSGSTR
jgi:Cu+-exporting ATPase